MRLTAQDRRRKLLAAATELFASKGFGGTTARQIAAAAGVTEAIVYRHFRSKDELYWAVLDSQCSLRGSHQRLKDMLAGSGSDVEVFTAIGADLLRQNLQDSHLARLLLYSALENHKLSHRFFRTYISEYYETVAARIRDRIRRHEFRRVNPLLAARGFIGMFFYHFLIQELFGGKQVKEFDPAEVSRTLTSVWLEGMTNGHAPHANGSRKVQHS